MRYGKNFEAGKTLYYINPYGLLITSDIGRPSVIQTSCSIAAHWTKRIYK